MIAQGILAEGDSIELIDGILIRKDRGDKGGNAMSHGPRHGSTVVSLQEILAPLLSMGSHVRIQLPVTLANIQEPEPDVAVIRGKRQEFTKRHPGPADIVALIEVADSSLTFDRTTKQRLYSSAAIPVYWIVNLVDNQIEVYENPRSAEGSYARRTDYRAGQSVKLAMGPGAQVEVAVADVLPA